MAPPRPRIEAAEAARREAGEIVSRHAAAAAAAASRHHHHQHQHHNYRFGSGRGGGSGSRGGGGGGGSGGGGRSTPPLPSEHHHAILPGGGSPYPTPYSSGGRGGNTGGMRGHHHQHHASPLAASSTRYGPAASHSFYGGAAVTGTTTTANASSANSSYATSAPLSSYAALANGPPSTQVLGGSSGSNNNHNKDDGDDGDNAGGSKALYPVPSSSSLSGAAGSSTGSGGLVLTSSSSLAHNNNNHPLHRRVSAPAAFRDDGGYGRGNDGRGRGRGHPPGQVMGLNRDTSRLDDDAAPNVDLDDPHSSRAPSSRHNATATTTATAAVTVTSPHPPPLSMSRAYSDPDPVGTRDRETVPRLVQHQQQAPAIPDRRSPFQQGRRMSSFSVGTATSTLFGETRTGDGGAGAGAGNNEDHAGGLLLPSSLSTMAAGGGRGNRSVPHSIRPQGGGRAGPRGGGGRQPQHDHQPGRGGRNEMDRSYNDGDDSNNEGSVGRFGEGGGGGGDHDRATGGTGFARDVGGGRGPGRSFRAARGGRDAGRWHPARGRNGDGGRAPLLLLDDQHQQQEHHRGGFNDNSSVTSASNRSYDRPQRRNSDFRGGGGRRGGPPMDGRRGGRGGGRGGRGRGGRMTSRFEYPELSRLERVDSLESESYLSTELRNATEPSSIGQSNLKRLREDDSEIIIESKRIRGNSSFGSEGEILPDSSPTFVYTSNRDEAELSNENNANFPSGAHGEPTARLDSVPTEVEQDKKTAPHSQTPRPPPIAAASAPLQDDVVGQDMVPLVAKAGPDVPPASDAAAVAASNITSDMRIRPIAPNDDDVISVTSRQSNSALCSSGSSRPHHQQQLRHHVTAPRHSPRDGGPRLQHRSPWGPGEPSHDTTVVDGTSPRMGPLFPGGGGNRGGRIPSPALLSRRVHTWDSLGDDGAGVDAGISLRTSNSTSPVPSMVIDPAMEVYGPGSSLSSLAGGGRGRGGGRFNRGGDGIVGGRLLMLMGRGSFRGRGRSERARGGRGGDYGRGGAHNYYGHGGNRDIGLMMDDRRGGRVDPAATAAGRGGIPSVPIHNRGPSPSSQPMYVRRFSGSAPQSSLPPLPATATTRGEDNNINVPDLPWQGRSGRMTPLALPGEGPYEGITSGSRPFETRSSAVDGKGTPIRSDEGQRVAFSSLPPLLTPVFSARSSFSSSSLHAPLTAPAEALLSRSAPSPVASAAAVAATAAGGGASMAINMSIDQTSSEAAIVDPPVVAPPKRVTTPEPSDPAPWVLALTRLADLEAQMEYAYGKHRMLMSEQVKLHAQYQVLEMLPVGMEALVMPTIIEDNYHEETKSKGQLDLSPVTATTAS